MTAKQHWNELSRRAGRNDLPRILFDAITRRNLIITDLPKAITNTWTACEWPLQQASAEVWLYVFALAVTEDEFITDDGILKPNSELPETVRVYRGCVADYREGLSWTTNKKRAQWFATRLETAVGRGHLYTTEIERENILAVYHDRGEEEYVIDVTYAEIEELPITRRKTA